MTRNRSEMTYFPIYGGATVHLNFKCQMKVFIAMVAVEVIVGIAANFSDSSESDNDNEYQRLVREPFTIRQISERINITKKGRYHHLTAMNKLYNC